MRVDIGRSRYRQICAAAVATLGAAAWVQIGWVRGGSVGDWRANLPGVPHVDGWQGLLRLSAWPAFLGLLALWILLGLSVFWGLLALARLVGGRTGAGQRRTTRLVLLGHADARVYWQSDPGGRGAKARRKRASGGGDSNADPTSGVDDVCIVEMVQWGGFCLWLIVCPRYPAPASPRRAWPGAWFARGHRGARRWLCIPADAVTPERFHALCARCQAMRRGAGFLSPW